jgi:hypothetical protein
MDAAIIEQIKEYIGSQPEPKRSDMEALHQLILKLKPGVQLWFEDGRNSEGKIVSNPNIGYGSYIITYSDGKTREFFQIGLSGNTNGISIYIMGLKDKTDLVRMFGHHLGKAKITGYCIRFKALKDLEVPVLESAIRYGFEAQQR